MLTNPKRSHSAKAYNVSLTQIFILIHSVARCIRKVGQTLWPGVSYHQLLQIRTLGDLTPGRGSRFLTHMMNTFVLCFDV